MARPSPAPVSPLAADLPASAGARGYGQVVELGTGWYLRGDLGYTDYPLRTTGSSAPPPCRS